MPIRVRGVAAAALTAALTGAVFAAGAVPATAAPADCRAVDSARVREAVACIPDLRRRAEKAAKDAAIADEAYNTARSDAKRAKDEAEALRLAADRAERLAADSKARWAAVAASMARGGGSVGQTTEVLLSGEGAGQVLYNLSRVTALGEDTSTLAGTAARDSAAAQVLRTEAADAAARATAAADSAKTAYDEAKKSAENAIALLQQTESKRDRRSGASSRLEAAFVDLPADASTAARVLAFARAQIGEPYVFGSAGPSSWDCSGLTMMAFQAAGIPIGGHGATVQFTTARAKNLLVPYSQAQPGDLVFYGTGDDKYHVAMYSGGGKMVEAARPGTLVREVPVRTVDLTPVVARYTG